MTLGERFEDIKYRARNFRRGNSAAQLLTSPSALVVEGLTVTTLLAGCWYDGRYIPDNPTGGNNGQSTPSATETPTSQDLVIKLDSKSLAALLAQPYGNANGPVISTYYENAKDGTKNPAAFDAKLFVTEENWNQPTVPGLINGSDIRVREGLGQVVMYKKDGKWQPMGTPTVDGSVDHTTHNFKVTGVDYDSSNSIITTGLYIDYVNSDGKEVFMDLIPKIPVGSTITDSDGHQHVATEADSEKGGFYVIAFSGDTKIKLERNTISGGKATGGVTTTNSDQLLNGQPGPAQAIRLAGAGGSFGYFAFSRESNPELDAWFEAGMPADKIPSCVGELKIGADNQPELVLPANHTLALPSWISLQ